MLTLEEYSECLQETLQDLQEDAALLQLALLGAQASIDELTLSCLLRLSDYLKQHVDDICVLCRGRTDASACHASPAHDARLPEHSGW